MKSNGKCQFNQSAKDYENHKKQYRLPGVDPVGFLLPLLAIHAQTYTNFTTIDDPLAAGGISGGCYAEGIYSNIVVGYFYNGSGRHGFYHVLGTSTYTTLDDPASISTFGTNTAAYGISGRNIVGLYVNTTGTYGFLYNLDSGTYYTLSDPSSVSSEANYTEAYGIDGTNIVGYYIYNAFPGDEIFSFVATFVPSQPGSYSYSACYSPIPSKLMATYTNYTTYTYGISGSQVVGSVVDTNSLQHGYVYNLNTQDYTFLTNSTTGGIIFPNGISGNQVVGHFSDPAKNFNYSGFLLTLGTMNLIEIADPLGVEATYAQGISDGLIVGYYVDGSGADHGFVVGTPTVSPPVVDLVNVSGNQLAVTVTNGVASTPFVILSSPNLQLPLNQWTVVSSNVLSTNGSFTITNTISLLPTNMFYRVVVYP
jgi:hypothetical protein